MWSYEEFIGDRHSDEGSTGESANGHGRPLFDGAADEKNDGDGATDGVGRRPVDHSGRK